MRKSPKWVAKYVVGGIKLSLAHPQTDRAAKMQAWVWSLLLLVTLMNITMALLLGSMNPFMVGLTLVGLCIYTVCLRWALKGLRYRAMLKRESSDRKAFNQIVAGL